MLHAAFYLTGLYDELVPHYYGAKVGGGGASLNPAFERAVLSTLKPESAYHYFQPEPDFFFSSSRPLEVYVGSVGHGVQWDTVN